MSKLIGAYICCAAAYCPDSRLLALYSPRATPGTYLYHRALSLQRLRARARERETKIHVLCCTGYVGYFRLQSRPDHMQLEMASDHMQLKMASALTLL